MSIGANIKARRLELGLSQEDLALAMGYKTRSAVAKIESGENEVPVSKLLPLSNVLDVSVEYLLAGGKSDAGFRSDRGFAGKNSAGGKVGAVILAGGRSTRNLKNIPNQFINVHGKPVIMYCLEAYQRHPLVSDIYVVCLRGWEDIVSAYADEYGITKLRDVVRAGKTGILSARNGLERMLKSGYGKKDTVIFQESTRPFVDEETISRLIKSSVENDSAILCEPMCENVQFYKEDDGCVTYLDRSRVLDLQSPDAHNIGFAKSVFYKAEQEGHSMNESNFGMLMYNLGFPVFFCDGAHNNLKIVRQEDLAIFTALLKQGS